MANLYEIVDLIEQFEFDVIEHTGEIVNGKEFENLELKKQEKIEGVGLLIKNLLSDVEAYEKEEKHFNELKVRAKKKAENIKKYLDYFLQGEKFKTTRVNISYRKSESVKITNESLIPTKYLKPSKPTIDKTQIKKDINDGVVVKGAEISVNHNMQVK